MRNKIINFIRQILLSYAAILFCGSQITGFIFLLATFVNFKAGLLGLIGAASAVFFAYRMKISREYVNAGIFGCNGILIGLAWGHYFDFNLTIIIVLAITAWLSNHFILYLIENLGKKYELPTLSLSFVVFAWLGIIIFKIFKFSSGHSFIWGPLKHTESYFADILPFYFQTICKTISFTFFQSGLIVGLLAFLGILFYSRISFLFALLSGVSIYFVLQHLKFSGAEIPHLGFNSIFTALAFGGFFLRLSFTSAVFTFIAVFLCLAASWILMLDLSYLKLPILAMPFNLTALLVLVFLRLRSNFIERYNFQLIPLDKIKSPEENLNIFYAKKVKIDDFCFPFYGAWKVSQGINGRYTHKDAGKYALDFWVADGKGSTFNYYGLKAEDYYSFNLPVTAPCAGRVVKVVNNIFDNPVGRPNADFPWGNYVIIDYKGVYVEISHFKCGSILVKEGDMVVRGQILGRCGNSGRSYQPHIHIQIQDKPIIGAQTLLFEFDKFIKINHEGEKIEINKTPQEGDLVKNFAENFDIALEKEFFLPEAKTSYINQIKKVKEEWRIISRSKIGAETLKCGLNQSIFEFKNGIFNFKRGLAFKINSLSRFLFGFYKIPKFLKTNNIWILEENNINWAGILSPGSIRKNIVKNKYLGKSKININGAEFTADKFSSSFLISKDIWLKETYLMPGFGAVKMAIFKNGELTEDWEIIEKEAIGGKLVAAGAFLS